MHLKKGEAPPSNQGFPAERESAVAENSLNKMGCLKIFSFKQFAKIFSSLKVLLFVKAEYHRRGPLLAKPRRKPI